MSEHAGGGPVVSLPKGGGAVKGLGETFSPDLFTGTGNFSLPLDLPPGRNGFQPQLRLDYSTGNGSGPFGYGWSLSVPGIVRKTSAGIPRYREGSASEADVFILSGAEDLTPVDGGAAGAQRYRPRTEGLFAAIERVRAGAEDYWRVQGRDGVTNVYGRAASADADPPVVANPAARAQIFAWRLSSTEDPFGNRIEYDYRRDAAADGPRQWDQLYLRRVRYVNYTGAAGEASYLVSVTFLYDDDAPPPGATAARERPDPLSAYRSGFEIRTRRRCKWIVVRTHTEAAPDQLVRAYECVYLDERAGPPGLDARLPLNGGSLLSELNVIGYDAANQPSRERPPLECAYSPFQPAERRFAAIAGADLPSASLADPDSALVDLFGHGLPDIVEMNGGVRFWRNLGGGEFDRPRPMADAPAGMRLADSGVRLIDAGGDGRTDLLVAAGAEAGFYSLTFEGGWDRARLFTRYAQAPTFTLDDPEVRLVDLDGDGITDAVRSGARMECYFNDARRGWQPGTGDSRMVERRALPEFPDVTFSDPRVSLADMSGDGLQDIVLIHDGDVAYWPHCGYGNWAPRVRMRNSPRLPYGYDPRRLLIGDVDGDGLADIVYVEDRKVTLWINRSGNAWSDPVVVRGTPAVTDASAVRLADLLGGGVSGLLWSRDAAGDGRPHHFFLDFTGSAKPYVLTEMNNNMGAVTTVTYASSTKFYLADQRSPATKWKTSLPFPVQVVERVKVSDRLSGGTLTTEYRYHHGYWDGAEREFRGFGMVEHLDTEILGGYAGRALPRDGSGDVRLPAQAAFSPPVLTRTWFHQGAVGREDGDWREQECWSEFWPGDPQLLEHKEGIDTFLATLSAGRTRRDALRALRGRTLRTELYALDGTAREERPYTVSEFAYALSEIDPLPIDSGRRHIFFPHPVAQRVTQWERGDDPMTALAYTADYDDYGQPRRALAVACPRGWRRMADAVPATYLATLSLSEYAAPLDAAVGIRNRVAKKTAYEVVNEAGTARTLQDIVDRAGTAAARRITGQSLTFYDGDTAAAGFGGFAGLPFGQVGRYGAAVRIDTLVMTDEIVAAAYGSLAPPYLTPGAPFQPSAQYPADFVARLPALAGYQRHDGVAGPHARGFFATQATRHDFHNAAGTGRGLVLATRDPLGHETASEYDEPCQLFPVAVTNPAGLVTRVAYDYRVMQPCRVTDPNGNVSDVVFAPSGLVAQAWVRGKLARAEADRNEPCVRMEYGLRAFYESVRRDPSNPQPVYVRVIRRTRHDTDAGDTGEAIETRDFSDGFGRLLQTRTQAEDVAFGDPLPAGQDDAPATGALVLGRLNADPATPNVVVSGWQVYDNKGRPIERYEPFFDRGWAIQPEAEARRGVCVSTRHDPRGRAIRIVNPDGSETSVVQGVPQDLADPTDTARVIPTPWEAYHYDANDNAGRTHAADAAAARYRHHWNTPVSTEVDALGRIVRAVTRHRERPASDTAPLPPIETHVSRSTFDVHGNLLTAIDALGRVAFRHVYDLSPRLLRAESLDGGVTRAVFDASGQDIERTDAKGAACLRAFDAMNRPLRMWARDTAADGTTLREKLVYGDDAALAGVAAAERNLLGKPYQYFDEAGLVTASEYDFKGNLLASSRRVLSDAFMLANVNLAAGPEWRAPAIDWDAAAAGAALDEAEYRTRSAFDALNRVQWSDYPRAANGERFRLAPVYDRAGTLARVDLEGPLGADDAGPRTPFLQRLAYNARGQRTLVAYGNGVITRYAYDPVTFRLARVRTEFATQPAALAYQPGGHALQDLAYEYDLSANIVRLTDRTPGSGVRNNPDALAHPALQAALAAGDALIREFAYDPLYRLASATGRECRTIPAPRPMLDAAYCGYGSGSHGTASQDNAPDLTATYEQRFEYDAGGNMLRMEHRRSGTPAWSRYFGIGGATPKAWKEKIAALSAGLAPDWGSGGNRLTHAGVDEECPGSHTFDPCGNLVREHTERFFEWTHGDRMKGFRTQSGAAEPSVFAVYLYDAAGHRVKKLVRRQGGRVDTTVYASGAFEHHRRVAGGVAVEHDTLHVMDDQQRIATARIGDPFPEDGAAAHPIQYRVGDHLDSSAVVVSADGSWINREEFFPYGESSFGGYRRKRYRFGGKERDEESGLHYHVARYYASWLARWVSVDPVSQLGGAYQYCSSSPLGRSDGGGRADAPAPPPPVPPAASAPPPTLAPAPPPTPEWVLMRGFQDDTRNELGRSSRMVVNERAINSEGRIFVGTPYHVITEGTLGSHTHPNDPGGRRFPFPSMGSNREVGDINTFITRNYRDNVILRPDGVTYFRNACGVPYVTVYQYSGKPTAWFLVTGSSSQGFALQPISEARLTERIDAAIRASRTPTVEMPVVVQGSQTMTKGMRLTNAAFRYTNGALSVIAGSLANSPDTYNYNLEQAEFDYFIGARSEPPHLRDQRQALREEIRRDQAAREQERRASQQALEWSLQAAGGHSGSDR